MDIKVDTNCNYDEDEVFFGRLTLKEVKKRIFMDFHQKNITNLANPNGKDLNSNDLKIIERSSQPNMVLQSHIDGITVEHLKSTSDPLFNRDKQYIQLKITPTSDYECQDSFLEIEKNVTEQCKPPNNYDSNLDNTLEFVDFILNHAQSHVKEKNAQDIKEADSGNDDSYFKGDKAPKDEILSQSDYNDEKSHKLFNNIDKNISDCGSMCTPIKCEDIKTVSKCNNIKPEIASALNTPICKSEVSNFFKTPKIPQSSKKDTYTKKTPTRLKAYQHIASPIATYIRNCPQVPLVKDIHPKKPLPSTSLIPKPLKNAPPEGKTGKENIVLPQLAYRSAKKTLVIDVNQGKLPQSHRVQKLTTLSQKSVVLKHNHREAGRKPLLLHQEDSFQDLPLHQAEVSICTQKLAFNKL